ncbi:TIGR04222 domain-containing membrane protein [Streptomyces sp. NPDC004779]
MDVIGGWPEVVPGLVLVVLSLGALVRFWRAEEKDWRELAASAGPVRPSAAGLSLYEIAYLAQGYRVDPAGLVALVVMHEQQRVRLVDKEYGSYHYRIVDPVPRDEVEAVVLDLLAEDDGRVPTALDIQRRRPDALKNLHRQLVVDGYLCERGLPAGLAPDATQVTEWRAVRTRARRRHALLLVVLLTLGGAAAVLLGAWAPLALQAVALPALAIWRERTRTPRSWGVTRACEDAVRAARAVRPASKEDALLRRVAFSGLRDLPKGHPLVPCPRPPDPPREQPREEPPRFIDFNPPGLGGL